MKLGYDQVPLHLDLSRGSLRTLARVSTSAVALFSTIGALPNTANAQPNAPRAVLTRLIGGVETGGLITVTKHEQYLGSKGTHQGYPVEFRANGKNYFAYTQNHRLKLDGTPGEIVDSMDIVAHHAVTGIEAHANKAGFLIVGDDSTRSVGSLEQYHLGPEQDTTIIPG